MTAINIASDIPSQIDTLEKLAAWVGLALARCNPTLKILEDPDVRPQRASEVVLIKADDSSYRIVLRISLPITDDYATSKLPQWSNVKEFSNTALPTAFKSN